MKQQTQKKAIQLLGEDDSVSGSDPDDKADNDPNQEYFGSLLL